MEQPDCLIKMEHALIGYSQVQPTSCFLLQLIINPSGVLWSKAFSGVMNSVTRWETSWRLTHWSDMYKRYVRKQHGSIDHTKLLQDTLSSGQESSLVTHGARETGGRVGEDWLGAFPVQFICKESSLVTHGARKTGGRVREDQLRAFSVQFICIMSFVSFQFK